MEFEKDSYKLKGFFRGKVLDNDDPDELGKIKVEVFSIFDGILAADLPWAVPAMPMFTGAGFDHGCFSVPEINSYVWCFFEQEDVYQPVYFAEALDGVHGLPTERTTNYPNRKVWKTKNGFVIYIDDTSGSEEVKVLHPSGAFLKIDNSGNITISGTTVNINP